MQKYKILNYTKLISKGERSNAERLMEERIPENVRSENGLVETSEHGEVDH